MTREHTIIDIDQTIRYLQRQKEQLSRARDKAGERGDLRSMMEYNRQYQKVCKMIKSKRTDWNNLLLKNPLHDED